MSHCTSANVPLLRSASPGVLHDCPFKRSNLILNITQGAEGHGSFGEEDSVNRMQEQRGEFNFLLPDPLQDSTNCVRGVHIGNGVDTFKQSTPGCS